MKKLPPEVEADLHRQLVKLGDMMGDGLHHEPGGKWISRDYKRICKALGLIPQKPRRKQSTEMITEINSRMAERCEEERCPHCKLNRPTLKQTRKGSMSAKCTICGRSFKLLRKGKAQ